MGFQSLSFYNYIDSNQRGREPLQEYDNDVESSFLVESIFYILELFRRNYIGE